MAPYIQPSTLYEVGVKTPACPRESLDLSRLPAKAFDVQQSVRASITFDKGRRDRSARFPCETPESDRHTTWQDPTQLNVPFLLGIPPSLLGLTPQQAYGGRSSDLGYIFGLERHRFHVGGQPHWVTSPFATVNVTRMPASRWVLPGFHRSRPATSVT